MDKEFYTVNEFAKLMNIHPLSIRKSIRDGRISAIKVGSGKNAPYRIPKHQIDKLTLLTEQELNEKRKKL